MAGEKTFIPRKIYSGIWHLLMPRETSTTSKGNICQNKKTVLNLLIGPFGIKSLLQKLFPFIGFGYEDDPISKY